MATNWTQRQLDAIETRDKTLLISAAAGSGKTATLTERIIRSLTDKNNPADISRMLIVTFTRAASAELKSRISDAITKKLVEDPTNKHLRRQLMALGSASISTIDSFYMNVVKSNFQRVSLPHSFRIADDKELALLRKSIMDDVTEEFYRKFPDEESGFSAFATNFISRGKDDTLGEMLFEVYDKVRKFPEGIDYIDKCAELLNSESDNDFFETKSGRLLAEIFKDKLLHAINVLDDHLGFALLDASLEYNLYSQLNHDLSAYREIVKAIDEKNYSAMYESLNSYESIAFGRKRIPEELKDDVKALRDFRNGFVKEIKAFKNIFPSHDLIPFYYKTTANVLEMLSKVLHEFEDRFTKEKLSRSICEFNDISHYALKLLVDENGEPTDIALAIRDKYDYVYIDEYQDVDSLQDMVFRAVSRDDNRFMVGDIKQSIYSFRGAEPTIFASYKRSFPLMESGDAGDGYSIFMSNNFRCDKSIVDFSNAIFRYLFGYCGKSIEYTQDDDLVFSKLPPSDDYASPKVNVIVVRKPKADNEAEDEEDTDDTDDTTSELGDDAEVRFIVSEILHLMRNGTKANGSRFMPKDFAIITRSKTGTDKFTKLLNHYGIEVSNCVDEPFFESPDVLLILSLLTTVDNPHKDVFLAATLRSPFFDFTLSELMRIRNSADDSLSLYEALEGFNAEAENDSTLAKKIAYFFAKLNEYRDISATLTADALIRYIYKDLSVLSLVGESRENLLRLYDYARKFEGGAFKGLYNFISFINELIEKDSKMAGGDFDADSNSVKILTIHKSKGLEFPVCFIASCHKPFSDKEYKSPFIIEKDLGIGIKLADYSGFSRIDSPIYTSIEKSIRVKQAEEEMRLLYVALTRARERLYVTSKLSESQYDKLLNNIDFLKKYQGREAILSSKKYIDWIIPAISLPEYSCKDAFELHVIDESDIDMPSLDGANEYETRELDQEKIKEYRDIIRQRFDFEYSHAATTEIPAKLYVSKLYPGVLDESEVGKDLEDISALPEFSGTPDFMLDDKESVTAAEKGTATHAFLQFCDFSYAEAHGVKEELQRLIEKKFIPKSHEDLVNIEHLEAFFESDFYSSLKKAKRVFREQRFHLLMPASDFTQNSELAAMISDEKLLVQGVIDIFFEDENGDIILCDYKTDYLTPAEISNPELAVKKLTERHSSQLYYYADAIEKIIGKAPSRVCIYSLPLKKAVDISIK